MPKTHEPSFSPTGRFWFYDDRCQRRMIAAFFVTPLRDSRVLYTLHFQPVYQQNRGSREYTKESDQTWTTTRTGAKAQGWTPLRAQMRRIGGNQSLALLHKAGCRTGISVGESVPLVCAVTLLRTLYFVLRTEQSPLLRLKGLPSWQGVELKCWCLLGAKHL